jgi:hypothetical protein
MRTVDVCDILNFAFGMNYQAEMSLFGKLIRVLIFDV